VEIYTSLEGDLQFLQDCPRDALGNDIIHLTVSFLHTRPGLEMLNAYVAATFISGEYDERVFTLHLDERMMQIIQQEFKLHPTPYIDRALLWLWTARKSKGCVPIVRYFVE
jgi:hypothetical protein